MLHVQCVSVSTLHISSKYVSTVLNTIYDFRGYKFNIFERQIVAWPHIFATFGYPPSLAEVRQYKNTELNRHWTQHGALLNGMVYNILKSSDTYVICDCGQWFTCRAKRRSLTLLLDAILSSRLLHASNGVLDDGM